MRAHWEETFLRLLRKTGSVNIAADRTPKSRSTVYYHRSRDAEFRRQWDAAIKFYYETHVRRSIGGSPPF